MTSNSATYSILIRTQPHGRWMAPTGWSGYPSVEDARLAKAEALRRWMSAAIVADDGSGEVR